MRHIDYPFVSIAIRHLDFDKSSGGSKALMSMSISPIRAWVERSCWYIRAEKCPIKGLALGKPSLRDITLIICDPNGHSKG